MRGARGFAGAGWAEAAEARERRRTRRARPRARAAVCLEERVGDDEEVGDEEDGDEDGLAGCAHEAARRVASGADDRPTASQTTEAATAFRSAASDLRISEGADSELIFFFQILIALMNSLSNQNRHRLRDTSLQASRVAIWNMVKKARPKLPNSSPGHAPSSPQPSSAGASAKNCTARMA